MKGSLSDLFDELPKLKYSLDHDLLEFYDEFLEPTETRYSNGYDMEFYKSCDKGLASKPLDAKHPQFGKTDYFVKSLVWQPEPGKKTNIPRWASSKTFLNYLGCIQNELQRNNIIPIVKV